ncbi:MAG: ComEA family DNA-binding protein [Beijerinckiaceae bacterium]
MSFKTIIAALALTAAASTASFAQTTQPTNPARPGAQPTAPAAPTAPAVQRPASAQSQLVNLNTAPASDLDNLPQIGAARSAAIIAKRPYKDWNDFVAKNVVPANAEAAIKDKVRFR